MGHVRATIVAVGKQWALHNLCVCVCVCVCARVRARLGIQNAVRMRHIVICVLPRSTVFFHIIS
jgi:hypothetical protein